ncbi:MAG TPA: hypothetical protein VNW99_10020 [Cytophagaceae bacterium]|nr:hypothetical protein [Cytophagaceae bacterium]
MRHLNYIFIALGFAVLASCAGQKKEEQSSKDSTATGADSVAATPATSNATFSVWLEGKLNEKYLVWMYLDAKDGKVTGKYRYLPKKAFLTLEGTITPDRQISLNELDDKGQVTGTITGKINLGKKSWTFLEGKWQDPKQTKSLSVNLSPLFLTFSQDTLINTGKYQFTVSRIAQVECHLGSADSNPTDAEYDNITPTPIDTSSILAGFEKTGAIGSQDLVLNSKYYEKIRNFKDQNLLSALNKAIIGEMKETPLEFSVPAQIPVKGEDMTGTFESDYFIIYSKNNIMTVSSSDLGFAYGAAHPYGNNDVISYNLDNGNQIIAGDLFDMKKINDLNNIIINNMDPDCKDAMNSMDDSGTNSCYKIPADAKSEYAFGITDKSIKVKLAGCSFPEVARYCNYVDIPKAKFAPVIRKDGPVAEVIQ